MCLQLSTEAQPETLTSSMQLLTVSQADGERPKPRSEAPAPTDISSRSTTGGMQGSVSSYTVCSDLAIPNLAGSNRTLLSPFKAKIHGLLNVPLYMNFFTFTEKYWVLLPALHLQCEIPNKPVLCYHLKKKYLKQTSPKQKTVEDS